MKYSVTLERTGVREIGRKSFSIVLGWETLGTAHTSTSFHTGGTRSCPTRDVFVIAAAGAARMLQKSLRTQLGIPSVPEALCMLTSKHILTGYGII